MKAKNLYYVMALCAGAFAFGGNTASAQDVFVDDAVTVTEFTCDNTNHYFANWRNNWFIEIGAGANQTLFERGQLNRPYAMKTVDAKKWTANYSFGFGRWFSPYFGFRFKAIGGALHWDTPMTMADYEHNWGWSHSKHVNLNLELMWDMFNSIGGFNQNRVFSIVPFIGLGGDCAWDFHNNAGVMPPATNVVREHSTSPKHVVWTLPVSAGLQFRFRLCKYVDFFAEARAAFYPDNFNNVVGGDGIETLVSAMGGFNFNIGGRGWNTFNECNYVSQIAALNGQVNDLRAQLAACGETVALLQSQPPCPENVQKDCVNAPLMATVRFTINSSKIMPTEEVNIYTMAKWLENNPNENIVIAGYADKDTGTSEYNMQLSKRRAIAVAQSLMNDYGVSRDRLKLYSFGSDVQEYTGAGQNDWNRIVIFKQSDVNDANGEPITDF